jgi:hypothetical protein
LGKRRASWSGDGCATRERRPSVTRRSHASSQVGTAAPPRLPVRVGSLIAPFCQPGHNLGMCSGTAKGLHRLVGFPRSQRPEGATNIDQQSSAQKSRRAPHLPPALESSPNERGHKPPRPDAETGDGHKHQPIVDCRKGGECPRGTGTGTGGGVFAERQTTHADERRFKDSRGRRVRRWCSTSGVV